MAVAVVLALLVALVAPGLASGLGGPPAEHASGVAAASAEAHPALQSPAVETRVRASDLADGTRVGARTAVGGILHPDPDVFYDPAASGWLVAPRAPGVKPGAGSPVHSPDFVVHPNGEIVPVPRGAVGPTPVRSGDGFQFTGGSGGHGLDARVTDIRIMDLVTSGKYPYPHGYVSYSNAAGQAVNPWTGQTVSRSSPWWHWPWSGSQP